MKLPSAAERAWTKFKTTPTKNKLLLIGGVLLVFMIVTPILTYAWFARDIADKERLMNHSNTGVALVDMNGKPIYSYGRAGQAEITPLNQISDQLERAVVASEDQDFFAHQGFSIKGIAAAVYANMLNKDATRYGGSTITQQLVKNNLLSSEKNVLRKYQELSLAIGIERKYTKAEILEMYLNSVYFGEGAFGIKAAAKTYFNKAPQDLTLDESTYLVGILPAPNAYSPYGGDLIAAEKQQERVLKLMKAENYISESDKKTATEQKLTFVEQSTATQTQAQHFTQMVIQELNKTYGEEKVRRSGFKVTTSMNLDWQTKAEAIVAKNMRTIRAYNGSNAAFVAIDPRTGQIRALIGSYDWNDAQFGKVNMATSPRQPGSSFKPIYYTEALDRKLITAATVMKDRPKTYANGYEPHNYDFRFRGDITVRNALATSLNIPALDVMEKVGVSTAADTAKRMGITGVNEPDKYGLTLALGTAEVKLLEMANAYAAFAHEGDQYKTATIATIQDKYGKTIYKTKPKAQRVQSKEASYIISSILSDNSARAPTFGSLLNIPGRKVAVKTGTTDENRDAWTIGYTPSLAIGAWVGNNTNDPMGVGGSDLAGPIWRSSMQQMLQDTPVEEFIRPGGVSEDSICVLGKTYKEVFIRGTKPADTCRTRTAPAQNKNEKKEEKEEQKEEDKKQEEEEGGRGGNVEPTQPPATPDPGLDPATPPQQGSEPDQPAAEPSQSPAPA